MRHPLWHKFVRPFHNYARTHQPVAAIHQQREHFQRLRIETLEDRLTPSLTQTQMTLETGSAVLFEGQPETFTATILTNDSVAGVPTGTVSFFDNGTPIGFAGLQVVHGRDQATYNTAGLSVGSHHITAVYAGDSIFAGSVVASGNALEITVKADEVPTMTAPVVTDLQLTSATLGGTVLGDGGTLLSTRGILVSPTATNASPTLGGLGVIQVDDVATTIDDFAVPVTGLTPGVSYSYVAYAMNVTGVGYSPVGTFTTLNTTTLAIDSPAITYGTDATITVTASSLGGTPAGTVSLTVDGGEPISQVLTGGVATFVVPGLAAGDHTLNAAYDVQSGFAGIFQTRLIHVDRASLTVTTDPQSKIYGADFTAFTGTVIGLKNGDIITAVYESAGAARTATVGNYAITATFDDPGQVLGNYVVNQTGSTLTVTPAPLTVSSDPQSKVYGIAVSEFTGRVSGLLNGDHVSAVYTSVGSPALAGVGEYAISATLNDPGSVLGNYAVTTNNGILTVTPASLTIRADEVTKAYGTAVPALTLRYEGFVNGDTPDSLTTKPTASTFADATSHAGVYDITVGGAMSPNYDIRYQTGFLVVNPAPLTVIADDQTAIYGATLPTFTVHYNGFVNGDDPSDLVDPVFVSTVARSGSSVGEYRITPGGAISPDYAITFQSGRLTITKAALTVQANDQSKIYGDAVPVLTYSFNGFVNGDGPKSLTRLPITSVVADKKSHVNDYAITVSGGSSKNYDLTYLPGVLHVTPAPLTVTPVDVSKVYGEALPTFSTRYNGFVNGDTDAVLSTLPVITTLATASSNVGIYSITAVGAASPDYVISYNTGTLNITPALLKITADNQSIPVGDVLPTLSVRYNGLVNGDTPGSLDIPPVLQTTATSASPAGSYPIFVGGALDPNYQIEYVAGSLTINDVLTKFEVHISSGITAGRSATLTVTAKDPAGNVDTDFNGLVHFAGTDTNPLAVLPPDGMLTNGVGRFKVTLVTAGPQTITVSNPVSGEIGTVTFTVRAGTARQLAFGEPLLIVRHGQALNPAPVVKLLDAFGNLVTNSKAPVKISVESGPGDFRNTSIVTVKAVGGVATFDNLVLDTEGAYTLKAKFGGLTTVISNNFIVDAPSEVVAGGLVFRTNDNSQFTVNAGVYTTTAPIVVSFFTGPNGVDRTLLKLTGTTTIDTVAGTFASTGVLSAVAGGAETPLLDSVATASIATLVGAGLTGLTGRRVSVAGGSFKLSSLALANGGATGLPLVNLQGALDLPVGLSVAVNGNNYVTIGAAGVSLTGASATLSPNFTSSGLTFDASHLAVNYSATSNRFSVTGNSTVTLPGGIGQINIKFGSSSAPGMVITNGVVTTLAVTLDSDLSQNGVGFAAKGLQLTYAADQYTMKGDATATIGGIGAVGVTFGGGTTHGLVITNGKLTGMDMAVTSGMTVQGVAFAGNNLMLSYTTAANAFTLAGTAGLTINGVSDLTATFGQGSKPGLVLTNGALTSLNLSVTGEFKVGGVAFAAKALSLTYTAADGKFSLTGSAKARLGVTEMDVNFGQGPSPSLVVTNGVLTSLDMAVTDTFTVAGVLFTSKNLRLTYSSSNNAYSLTGGATVAVGGTSSLEVTFGQGPTPGLVLANGTLSRLNLTVSGEFTVGAVVVTPNGLNLTYTATDKTFTMTGAAGLRVAGISNLNVTFGQGSTPGLVIRNGDLTSLNLTVTGSFNVASVAVEANSLNLTYTAASSKFTMTGGAKLTVGGIADLTVKFGSSGTPGLVITNGSLTSLDMTLDGSFKVAGVTITAKSLNLAYTATDTKFAMIGTAEVAVVGMGKVIVKFGSGTVPGLVITAGSLTSLSMTVDGSFKVADVTVTAKSLNFTYTSAGNQFTMTGTAEVAVDGMGNVSVKFGSGGNPGLVVTAGSLTSLDMTVDGSFKVAGVTVTSKSLNLTYTSAGTKFTMTGKAVVAIAGMGSLSVTFGSVGNPGLVVANGSLVSLDLTVDGYFTVAAVTITAKSLRLTYAANNSTFTLSGDADVSIKGMGNLSVTFGSGGTPGLIVTNGSLVSLDVTVTGSFTVSLVTVTATKLNLSYTAAGKKFTLSGDASLAVKGMGSLAVTFGTATKPGLVIVDGALESMDVTVTGSFTVASVTIAAKKLNLSYTAAQGTTPATFAMSGEASVAIAGMGQVAVKFAEKTGLVITDGSLTSLDMTVDGSFTVASVRVEAVGLRLIYKSAGNAFTMTGAAGLEIRNIGFVRVKFGDGATPGLVVTNGSLSRLDMTVDGEFKVSKVTVAAKGLHIAYTAATGTYVMSGRTSLKIDGLAEFNVTLGYQGNPGLVIVNGALKQLDMTVDSSLQLGKVTIFTQGLRFTYDADKAQFTLSGTAGVDIKGVTNLQVNFGGDGRPGLVITNGKLDYIEVSITSKFEIGRVKFGSNGLGFSYKTSTGKFTFFGEAFVEVKGIAELKVKFGDGTNPGIVVENGELQSLDVSVTSKFRVKAAEIFSKDLRFTWTKSKSTFTLSGSAGVKLVGDIAEVSVTFGYKGDPGLVITNGDLVKLDMTVNARFDVKLVTINAKDLRFTYIAATDTFTFSGGARLDIKSVGNVEVTFGYGTLPGLKVVNGKLESMAMTVNSDLSIGSAKLKVDDLGFIYTARTGRFEMSGEAALTLGPLASVKVSLGTITTPGLVITDGKLTSLNLTVDSDFRLYGFTFKTERLNFAYSSLNSTFTMTGKASINAVGLGTLGVEFGGKGNKGLVIANGNLSVLAMRITGDFKIAGVGFKTSNLKMIYEKGVFNVYGSAEIDVPIAGKIALNFGTPGDAMVFKDGKLDSVYITQSLGFSFGAVRISGNLDVNYKAATKTTASQIIITGNATVAFGGISASINLGGGGTRGVVFQDGKLVNMDGKITGSMVAGEFSMANADAIGKYDPATKTLRITGTVKLNLLAGTPAWAKSFLSSNLVGAAAVAALSGTYTVYLQYKGDNLNDSYVYASTKVLGIEAGITYNFATKIVTMSMGNPFEGLANAFKDLGANVGKAWQTSVTTLAEAFKDAGKGVAGVYNLTADALDSAYNKAQKALADAAKKVADLARPVISAVASAASSVWSAISSFGEMDGSTVYYDPNSDYNLGNDVSAVSRHNGIVSFPDGMVLTSGQLVAIGGTDISTGIQNNILYTAPYDAIMITPETTVINALMRQTGWTASMAGSHFNQVFGLSPLLILLNEDVLKEALAGSEDAARAFRTEVQIISLVYDAAGLINDDDLHNTPELSDYTFGVLARAVLNYDADGLNLADPATVRDLLQAMMDSAGHTVAPEIIAGAAKVVAAVNQEMNAVPITGGAAYIKKMVQAQKVSETAIYEDFEKAVSGLIGIDAVVTAHTGNNLKAELKAATTGTISADGPLLLIKPFLAQAVGEKDPKNFTFQVFLAAETPPVGKVTVQYATSDLTAIAANGDYTPVTGTLTWAAGDRAPKLIKVPVTSLSVPGENKQFLVELTNPTNAQLESPVGIGEITFTEYGTKTTLTASTIRAVPGQTVTLTASVIDLDPEHHSGTGEVTFYDGDTILGAATLTAGQATFQVIASDSGRHQFTARYTGNPFDDGLRFNPSASKVVNVTVTAGTQTITFDPLQNKVYGDTPFTVHADSTSGLETSYRIVSGPAKLIGDQVTITGAGTVVIEAYQTGNTDFNDATPVRQSFQIAPAPLQVAVKSQTMTYGDGVPDFAATLTGLVYDDDLASRVKFTKIPPGSGVGTYIVKASGITDPNYTVTYTDGTLEITPAILIIQPENKTKVYGSAMPVLTAIYQGFVNGDTVASLTTLPTLTTTATASRDVGTYLISASGAASPNYKFAYLTGNLFVTPATLTVRADSLSMTSGDVLPELTVQYNGFVNGDGPASLDALPLRDTKSDGTRAGLFAINVHDANDQNYTIKYQSGFLRVTRAASSKDFAIDISGSLELQT